MNKAQLVACVAEKTGMTKKDTQIILQGILEEIAASMERQEPVQLVGFGAFEVQERRGRVGRNPKTKEPITIPPTKQPVFRPGKSLKDRVANG